MYLGLLNTDHSVNNLSRQTLSDYYDEGKDTYFGSDGGQPGIVFSFVDTCEAKS